MSQPNNATTSHHRTAIPAGAGTLFFVQTFATLGFAVLYSTLVLYATKKLGFSEDNANAIMGVFGAFNYGLHMFGGYLGARMQPRIREEALRAGLGVLAIATAILYLAQALG